MEVKVQLNLNKYIIKLLWNKQIAKKNWKITKEIVKFLYQQSTSTKHKPSKKNFKREKVYV